MKYSPDFDQYSTRNTLRRNRVECIIWAVTAVVGMAAIWLFLVG